MNRNVLRSSVVAASLIQALLFTQLAHAAHVPRRLQLAIQQQAQQAAPVVRQTPPAVSASPEAEARARIIAAHTLFLANDGADDAFPRTTDGYNLFVADMQNWGRYHIVSNIADADLVLQLRSATTTTVVDGTADAPAASVYTNPYLRLTLADPATLKPLWVVTVPVRTGTRRKDKADLFALSVENAVSQVKLLAGAPLSAPEQAALAISTTRFHRVPLPWIILGIAVFITLPLVLFEVSKSNAKANQDNFCKANNIPLSMCAGG